jgi:NAD(P)H-flavin reductase
MINLIHRLGRSVFLRLENFFNGVFGPALNPFYYLGAIAYLMFWIIVVSGFYIYIFYDTGIEDSYASVERLTHEQWYLGGIMRSLHRYASDAMVLVAALHMLRNFFFDRYRNFRWFSWYTGIVAIWLVYMAGINGYWLVWDKLAQFTAVATVEWLGELPIFSAPMARNFLEQGSVNNRFFSLLSLLHIGLPLGTFALIWIHTQRVPQARTSPPKALTISLVSSMIVLALFMPVLSQGQADLDSVPFEINLDWYFLWSYPLIYSWGPTQVSALVGGATFFILLLPFLGGTKRGMGEHEITAVPCGEVVTARAGETILEASLRQGLNLPYVCRDGACGACKGKIIKGTVSYGIYQESALTEEEKSKGMALFCCAQPLTDIYIECHEVSTMRRLPVRTTTFKVREMRRVAQDVMLVELLPESNEQMSFIAGQYVAILQDDGSKRSFSIANAPHETDRLQLHVRLVEGGKFTGHVFNGMKVGDVLQVEGPLGSFFLHDENEQPIIFMCGGTGFAPVKSMVEHAFKVGLKRSMVIYWGCKSPGNLYLVELLEKWQQEHDNFRYIPVISDPKPEDNWHGRTGLVTEAILQDYEKLSDYQIYACGSPEMVEAGRTLFLQKGLLEDQYYSDAFLVAHHAVKNEGASVSLEAGPHG